MSKHFHQPLTREKQLDILAAQEAKWRARVAWVEEHGGVEDMRASDAYELIADTWHMAAELAKRVVKK